MNAQETTYPGRWRPDGGNSLPLYGPGLPSEDDIRLFGEIRGKVALDISCGRGLSLKYLADRGAAELWGADSSRACLDRTRELLSESGYYVELRQLRMEDMHSILESHFDFVYSIGGVNRSAVMPSVFEAAYRYLKPEGSLIISFDRGGLTADCVNALAGAGFFIERLVVPDGSETAETGALPSSFIIKAKKPPEYYY